MTAATTNPRILIVTPEITHLPADMGNMASQLTAKAGGLADVSAALVGALFDQGADVHVALPHYRQMFHVDIGKLIAEELRVYQNKLPSSRIHLAEDRIFYYRNAVYSSDAQENPKIALAFQREVINNIIPLVKPDLIHCNDWMTGLIPAMARRLNIPCLLTLHNIHTYKIPLLQVEDRGIDAAGFWQHLFFERTPYNYEESRATNQVDLLTSGIFASHFINTVSPTFLLEVANGQHAFVPEQIRREVALKLQAGCAVGILNAPDPIYNPATDPMLPVNFTADTHPEAKKECKRRLQQQLGLRVNDRAPVFFWPSRLDPVQKGCQLLADILYRTAADYAHEELQIVFIADGPFQQNFRNIAQFHAMYDRVAVCNFREEISRLAYAASDFMLMPSLFEPCGLPQMIACLYGSLPVVRDTGGLHDTVNHLDVSRSTGNGFVFETYDANGLRWAIDQAMDFHRQPDDIKARQIQRIMLESTRRFNHGNTAQKYIDIYEKMLQRPLINAF